MNKQDVYQFLNENNIKYEAMEHEAVYNMAELTNISLPHPEAEAKNLFVRDDKRKRYLLITVKGDKRVDLKEFRKEHGTRPLTFASEEELNSILGLTKGSVSPLGLLNDNLHMVEFYIDESFIKDSIIGIHPNDNTASVWLNPCDLISIIEKCGNCVNVITI